MPEHRTMNLPTTLGTLLSRLIVPGWILTGAIFKLVERTPTNLPQDLLRIGKWVSASFDIDLYLYLAFFLVVEFIAAGIMFLIPRLARATAITMMSIFVLVLLNELRAGNFESCGCYGSVKISPLVMLIIDGTLLIGLLVFPSNPRVGVSAARGWMRPIAALWLIAALGVTAGMILPERRSTVIVRDRRGNTTETENRGDGTTERRDDSSGQSGEENSDPNPRTQILPGSFYYETGVSHFADQEKRFLDIDLAQFVSGWPDDIEQGRWYVMFYGPTCDHCLEVAERNLMGDLPVKLAMVAIPERKTGFLDNPYDFRGLVNADIWLELPVGCNWILSTPVVFAVEDGIIKCAVEGEDPDEPQCLIWH